jgi:NADH-quinone oxidoreductase subunit H
VDLIDLIWMLIKLVVVVNAFLSLVPVLVWLERRSSAFMQDRLGPNRTNIFGFKVFGIIQNVADVVKFLLKEDFRPAAADRIMFNLGPWLVFLPAVVVVIVIPFADVITYGARTFSFQVADLDAGILFILAIASLGVYGFIMSGWASNNKFSLLGAMRSSAQMISYEVTLSLSVVGILMIYGTYNGTSSFELNHLIQAQGQTLDVFGLFALPKWGIFVQPLGFLLFLAASYAETNRLPFDMPEDEAALVAGYHTEYGGMKFAVFFMSEYVAMITASCLVVILFFGGWQVPWAPTASLLKHAGLVAQILAALIGLHLLGGAIFFRHLVTHERFTYGISSEHRKITDGLKKLGVYAMGLAGIVCLGLTFALPGQLDGLIAALVVAVVQIAAFVAKLGFFLFLYVWVRWTIPRFRYDQVMRLGWKTLLPLALFNIFITGAVSLALS